MDFVVDFFTRLGHALSGNGFVFVFRDFLVDRLRGSVTLSRYCIERFICSRVISDTSGFRIVTVGLYVFMIDEQGPIKFAYLSMLLDRDYGINSALGDDVSTIDRDLYFDDIFYMGLGLARLCEVNDDRFERRLRQVSDVITYVMMETVCLSGQD